MNRYAGEEFRQWSSPGGCATAWNILWLPIERDDSCCGAWRACFARFIGPGLSRRSFLRGTHWRLRHGSRWTRVAVGDSWFLLSWPRVRERKKSAADPALTIPRLLQSPSTFSQLVTYSLSIEGTSALSTLHQWMRFRNNKIASFAAAHPHFTQPSLPGWHLWALSQNHKATRRPSRV